MLSKSRQALDLLQLNASMEFEIESYHAMNSLFISNSLRACLDGVGWPVSKLARQQGSPALYERFDSWPALSQL